MQLKNCINKHDYCEHVKQSRVLLLFIAIVK